MYKTFDLDSLVILLLGTLTTIKIFLGTILISLFLGTFIGIVCSNKFKVFFISNALNFSTFIIRAIPSFVLVLFVYFATPEIFKISLPISIAAVIALGINASGFVSQIVKTGINVVEKGQWEAAYICGFNKLKTLKLIIIPQVLKNTLPILISEYTHMIKSTSAIATLGVLEVTKNGMKLVSSGHNPLIVYSIVGLIYIMISLGLIFFGKFIKKRVKYDLW